MLRHSDPLNGLGIQEIELTSTAELFIYKLIDFITHMTEVAVPIFFFISGFPYFSDFNSLNDYAVKVKKRVSSIVVSCSREKHSSWSSGIYNCSSTYNFYIELFS